MIVCFATMRYDPNFDPNITDAQLIARTFSELANDIITHLPENEKLQDTALSIIALVRQAGIHSGQIKNQCLRLLRSGVVNARYLEIVGLLDMEDLLRFLLSGNLIKL